MGGASEKVLEIGTRTEKEASGEAAGSEDSNGCSRTVLKRHDSDQQE
jgi:hypothetical protein